MRALLICLTIVVSGIAASAQERVALVIGMAAYETVVPLDNTRNDAIAISDTLRSIGFDVTTLLDTPGTELRAKIDEFAFRAETSDLALIYFAGHGVEVQGENYLIPIDANVQSNRDIQNQSVSLKDLLAAADRARKMRIVILDSCRDDPFGDAIDRTVVAQNAETRAATRSTGRVGLAPPAPDRGTLVAFAARDGEKALDGTGNNSPYAIALMDGLVQSGLEISLMFRQVRDAVLTATGNLQEPHTYGSLPGTPFYIAGTTDPSSTVASDDRKVAWADISADQESKLRALADAGDTRSLVGLAYMRLNANDARYDPQAAAQLLKKAADAGNVEAQFELAQIYETGLGVPQDVQRAVELYEQSAQGGFADALNDLGFLYFQGGLGLPRDPDRALQLFEGAADQGHPQALFNFAALIDDGIVAGKGPEDAAGYLYRSLRIGSNDVLEVLKDRPTMFSLDTRKALQRELARYGFYQSTIDGDFGPGTQRAIRAAIGLSE